MSANTDPKSFELSVSVCRESCGMYSHKFVRPSTLLYARGRSAQDKSTGVTDVGDMNLKDKINSATYTCVCADTNTLTHVSHTYTHTHTRGSLRAR